MPHAIEKNDSHTPAILIVPACERGRGGGHLSRSLLLLRSLRLKGHDTYLWIPHHLKDDFLQRFHEFFKTIDHPCFLSRVEDLHDHIWEFIVVDCFRSSGEEFAFWAGIAPLVGIDEGGPFRKRFDFLIDLLPSVSKHDPNLSDPGLLPLPKNRRSPPAGNASDSLRILVSFGAEDPVSLGPAVARALSALYLKNDAARKLYITLIAPIPPHDAIDAVKVIGKMPHLQEHFAEYDLLITHFGLGAFEALYARLPVMLISPTVYHEKLSRTAGFFSLGLGAAAAGRLENFSFDRDFLEALKKRGEELSRKFGLEEDQKVDLSSFVSSFNLHSPGYCPVCEKKIGALQVLARSREESYRRCPFCKIIFLSRLSDPPIEYEKDYFFDFYKKQYGKTYLEDFPNLVEMGRKRITVIKTMLDNHHEEARGEKPLVLDIGCAYGPFLAAAAECGFSPAGIDPAEDAVRYVKDELGFPAKHGFFPDGLGCEYSDSQFDAITLWYVIEHFKKPGKAFTEINRLLKKGGVVAFSTPSFSGASGRKNLPLFLKKSPPDHYTIWSPGSCKKIFDQYGFKLKRIVITGHHPERFPFFGRFLSAGKMCFLYRVLLFVSRVFRLGDTFEAYGVKR